MKRFLHTIVAGVVMAATPFSTWATVDWAEQTQDVVIIGEFHDNPDHHANQAEAVRHIQPKAVVFEMLTPEEASRLVDVPRKKTAMEEAVQGFHWSNISDYADILAGSSRIMGAALERDEMRAAFADGAAAVFGAEADTYGLTAAVPEDQLATRKQLQFEAHCEAMPLEMMGGMVEAQRLRDAAFARTILEALDTHGAPVILITGNGHARSDWGVPFYLKQARPHLTVATIAQGEEGRDVPGRFDQAVLNASSPDRGDPCDAFR